MAIATLSNVTETFPLPLVLDSVSKSASTMWMRLVFSLNLLFRAQYLLYAPHSYAGAALASNATFPSSTLAISTESTTSGTQITNATLTSSVILNQTASSTSRSSTNSLPLTSLPATVNTTSTSTSTTIAPAQTVDPAALQDIQTIAIRRLSNIIGAITTPASSIPAWLATLGPDGKWPDSEIDYTTGCAAQRANWPAEAHWSRILTMAAAWHGGLVGDDQFVKNPGFRASISSAMGYWFRRDFTNDGCLDNGGTPLCPCSNPDNSLWNTNWFSNIIGVPEFVSQTCLLLNDTLAPTELSNCTHITGRTYATFNEVINGLSGGLTGANALDVAKIGIDQALLTNNVSLITDAYQRVDSELQIKNGIKVDGIRADGSFGQHGGIIYNGNYGKDYANDLLDLEVEAGGTRFAASADSQNAFNTLFDGDRWMIFRNSVTGVLHWDFSVLGRFISFPVIDAQATGSININLTKVLQLGEQWPSATLQDFANDLSESVPNANAGKLLGNRIFYANDYMVNRGSGYVTTVRMYSARTQNTECTNSQNPEGFHLSDGTLYTYLVGNEYEDISAAWDWNLIPGITVDYAATPLTCGTTQHTGIETFVGGVSDGHVGAAVMKYTNPITKALSFQKAWFFLPNDIQFVMIPTISSTTNASVFSVLDQKRASGPLIVDERTVQSVSQGSVDTVWHANVGYDLSRLPSSATLTANIAQKSGDWSAIGISTQPPAVLDFFTAYIEHGNITAPIAYTIFPSMTHANFLGKAIQSRLTLQVIQNDATVSAVLDLQNQVAVFVFWQATGGTSTIKLLGPLAPVTVSTTSNLAVMWKITSGEVTVSDPSQSLVSAEVSFGIGIGAKLSKWGPSTTKTLSFQLPTGGTIGSSITKSLY